MGRSALKQGAWTLTELVLSIALTSVVIALISLCMYKPLHEIGAQIKYHQLIKPTLLASEMIRDALEQSSEVKLLSDSALLVGAITFSCDDTSLKQKSPEGSFVILQDTGCHFDSTPLANGKRLTMKLYHLHDALIEVNRVYFIEERKHAS